MEHYYQQNDLSHSHSRKLQDSYLDEDKKMEIIKSLDDEIYEMRQKYFLKQPN